MHELFHQLNDDVTRLEEESKILDDDIAKLKLSLLPVTVIDSSSSMVRFTDKILKLKINELMLLKFGC